MSGASLLQRQLGKSLSPGGDLDIKTLLSLVAAAYDEKDLDSRRADRASQLVAEELEDAFASLEVQNLRFKAALDNMSQGLCLFDRAGRLVVCNRRFLEIFGVPADAIKPNLQLADMLARSEALAAAEAVERHLLVSEHESLDSAVGGAAEQIWPDGRVISIVRKAVADGGYLDTVADITESRVASERITHLAQYDTLTDLPNRAQLLQRVAHAVEDGRLGTPSILLCLDLDRFKTINDTLGHAAGDALLVAVSRRLRLLVRSTDVVARLGGDEFAILQILPSSQIATELLARRVISALSKPYCLDGQEVRIGVSIGIESIGAETLDADEVLRNADLALYCAKAEGRGTYRSFAPAMHTVATRRRALEMDLRAALDEGQLEVHYQPQVNILDGGLSGFEALVRWRDPVRGLVEPAEFIPLAEEVGLIDRVGIHVLETACVDAMRWPKPVKVAVNLSALQFRTQKLVGLVDAALKRSGLAPERLELEVTESIMVDDAAGVLKQLRQLKQLGVKISLDDFGTGYSSLSYIRSFPFDKIKIDQSFVRELGTSADSLAIIRAVTGMCSSLGITTTAEGVETMAQLKILAEEKCDIAQGYFFGKPAPMPETYALFARSTFGVAA